MYYLVHETRRTYSGTETKYTVQKRYQSLCVQHQVPVVGRKRDGFSPTVPPIDTQQSRHHPSIEAGARILLFLPASLLINRENCDGVHRETSVFDSAVCAVTVAWVVAPLSLF